MPSDNPKSPQPQGIELPAALTPSAAPVQSKKFTGGKKAVEITPEAEQEAEPDFFASPGSSHAPRSTRNLLPVEDGEAGPAGPTPQQARKLRRKRSLFFRRLHAGRWMLPRKVARLHRRVPAPVVIGIYLGGALAVSALLGSFLLSGSQRPVTRHIEPPAPRQVDTLKEISVLIAAKDYDNAMKALEGPLASQPDDPKVHVMHGALLAARRQYPGAQAAFRKALDLSPGSAPVMFNLAEIEFVLGHYAEAGEFYTKLRPMMPENKMLLYRQYLCALMLDNQEDAQRVINSPLLPAQSPEWFYIKAAEAFRNGNKKEGQKLVEQARRLYGEKVRPHDQTLQRLGMLSADPW